MPERRSKLDAREFAGMFNYIGQERAARKLLLDKKLAKPEDVAVMTDIDVCSKLLKSYEVVSSDREHIVLVEKDKIEEYKKIANVLSR